MLQKDLLRLYRQGYGKEVRMEHIADTMTLNILCGVIVFMITRYMQ